MLEELKLPLIHLAFRTYVKDILWRGKSTGVSLKKGRVNIHGLFLQGAKWDFKKKHN